MSKCILYELLDVLESIHAQGILHCDLKPGNILYRGGGIAVCDWGRSERGSEEKDQRRVWGRRVPFPR